MPGKQRMAQMKEHRGEERLRSIGQAGQSGESGHAKEEKVLCDLWGKEGQGEGWRHAVTGRGGAEMETGSLSHHIKSDQQMVPRSETLPLRCRGTIGPQSIALSQQFSLRS